MWSSVHLLVLLISSASCFLYMNRTTIQTSSTIPNVTIDFFHDASGQCILNLSFTTYVAITKMRVYFKVNLAEDQFDREYKRNIVSTVFEVEKVFKGEQSNLVIKVFFTAIRKSMVFECKMPLQPVSNCSSVKNKIYHFFVQGVYRFVNLTFDTSLLRFLPEAAEMVDFRYVGNTKGSNKTIFFAHVALFGGIKHG